MTWQLATRGSVLRRVRIDAFPRAARVVGLQHQLQRLSLAATPRPARPLTGYLASPKSQAPSRSFATSTDGSEPKKTKKTTKKSKKPKKSTKPKKRELTEEQKAAKAERKKETQRRALVQQLKQTALTPPKRLPDQYFSLVVQDKYADVKTPSITQSEAFQAVSRIASSLSAEEKERYEAQARANMATNAAQYDQWLKQHTPLQIKEANLARRRLSTLVKKNYRQIRDDRLVKKRSSAFMFYVQERYASGDFRHMKVTDATSRVAQEWKGLTESEKQKYHDLQAEDQARYRREYLQVYGKEAPSA
ncbi:hypothetical protein N7474_000740 [Penicillium riverlandense]|uniref:uncharacterized protein n=1 Tax=Penicillium riverlandense TaxID=1903569 RepID=UPI002547F334|nr:uncharacterized protein N7474_000740 [Penicillium riverlandense]KAJ5832429.1 hypothetical protein N7474_000740 [Penicillium riverlandense]